MNTLVAAIVEAENGNTQNPRLCEALGRRDELKQKCIACHLKARKSDLHLSYDRDGGKLPDEVSLDPALLATETVDPDFAAHLRRDTSTSATAELEPEVEDLLRKAAATVVGAVEVRDGPVLLALLRREPLADARPKGMNRREFAASVRRALGALDRARSIIKHGDARLGNADAQTLRRTRRAAARLVDRLGSMLTQCDAPVLLGLLRGLSLAAIARAAGLSNRQAAHARVRSMLARLPELRPLHVTSAK